jgi:hypothetical protein
MPRHLRTVTNSLLCLCALGLPLVLACGDDDPGDPGGAPGLTAPLIVDETSVDDFLLLTPADCAAVRSAHRIYYGHTSHGSQLVTGMQMLAAENAIYAAPEFHEVGDDLGHEGDVSWAATTRTFLDAHPGEYGVVMWSWCGGVSDNTESGIATYLAAMAALEESYPGVVFVYMTGHLDGTGSDGNLRVRNDQIRAWCRAHDKVLFDFAAIERHAPDGTEYPDASDACEWCAEWCAERDCPACGGCAHSHCFNCYRKGQALWCLLAELPRG